MRFSARSSTSDSLNEVQNFIFEGLGIRGAIVRLEDTWSRVLAEHSYPDNVRELLGEAVAATVLLTTGLKSTPQLSLQLQGEGPITLLLIQCSSELNSRQINGDDFRCSGPKSPER